MMMYVLYSPHNQTTANLSQWSIHPRTTLSREPSAERWNREKHIHGIRFAFCRYYSVRICGLLGHNSVFSKWIPIQKPELSCSCFWSCPLKKTLLFSSQNYLILILTYFRGLGRDVGIAHRRHQRECLLRIDVCVRFLFWTLLREVWIFDWR